MGGTWTGKSPLGNKAHRGCRANSRSESDFTDTLKEAQLKTGKSIFSLLGADVLGSGAGAVVGAGAATATYLTVAGIATASTGAAISALSGAAATSATLAAIGGRSLAAGGLGIAGGTAVLTGIVALPVLVVLPAPYSPAEDASLKNKRRSSMDSRKLKKRSS